MSTLSDRFGRQNFAGKKRLVGRGHVPCIGFVAGGIILNTMIIELPRQKESYYPTFILGALVFCFLVLFE